MPGLGPGRGRQPGVVGHAERAFAIDHHQREVVGHASKAHGQTVQLRVGQPAQVGQLCDRHVAKRGNTENLGSTFAGGIPQPGLERLSTNHLYFMKSLDGIQVSVDP